MNEKVLVLYGGLSKEREVSIRSGKAVAASLRRSGFIVKEFDFKGKIETVLESFSPDVVFIALHGKYGEDGTVQGALEIAGVPYTGSGVLASAVCMNKFITKKLFNSLDIETAEFLSFHRGEKLFYNEIIRYLKSNKIVIKPVDQGSAIGVSIVDNENDFKKGIKEAFALSINIIVEPFINGKEITITVIGNNNNVITLPTIEIVPENDFYDYESKYVPGMSHHIIPARISRATDEKAKKNALLIYKNFGLRDFARIDFIVSNGIPFALEVNTIPGLTETSLVPDAARASGMTFDNLTTFVVNEALKRNK